VEQVVACGGVHNPGPAGKIRPPPGARRAARGSTPRAQCSPAPRTGDRARHTAHHHVQIRDDEGGKGALHPAAASCEPTLPQRRRRLARVRSPVHPRQRPPPRTGHATSAANQRSEEHSREPGREPSTVDTEPYQARLAAREACLSCSSATQTNASRLTDPRSHRGGQGRYRVLARRLTGGRERRRPLRPGR
jgi:hypothetical protein